MTTGLSRQSELINQLLRMAATSGAAPADSQADSRDYDWSVPARFVPAELKSMEALAGMLAGAVSERLGTLLAVPTPLSARRMLQVYGRDLGRQAVAGYSFELSVGGRPAGAMVLHRQAAGGWITRLLGGEPAPGESQGELSSVERLLLADVGAACSTALAKAFSQAGLGELTCASQAGTELRVQADEAAEFCNFTFAQEGSPDAAIQLLLSSELLQKAAGPAAPAGTPGRNAAAECRKAILAHLEDVDISAEAYFGQTRLPMRDIFLLEPGDVILLDQTMDEPVSLVVRGKSILTGTLVQSDGRYALQILAGESPGRRTESRSHT